MKPYGIPRLPEISEPDMGDIKEFARPGRVGNMPTKGGDIRSHNKNSAAKRATRRVYKRRARAEGKAAAACRD